MKALVYHGPGRKAWEEVAKPELLADTDAIVKVDAVTICGTDLHVLKGDVPAVTDGRILGHEAVGTVETVGTGVKNVAPDDRVLCRAAPHAALAASAGQAATASAWPVAVGSWATGSTAPRPSTCRCHSRTRRLTWLPSV
jgi:NADPH:quinone reductase-like Zn-dependent oxidoreductase